MEHLSVGARDLGLSEFHWGAVEYGVKNPPHSEICANFHFGGCKSGNNFVRSGNMVLYV
jgi:hypothetical protein